MATYKYWLLRYTLLVDSTNGWAIIVAKTANTAKSILLRLGSRVEMQYLVFAAEELPLQVLDCCYRDIIVAEGVTTKGEKGDIGSGNNIVDISYDDKTHNTIITMSDGTVYEFHISTETEPMSILEIISATNWNGN